MVVEVGCVCSACRSQCGAVRNCSVWFVPVNGEICEVKCIWMGVVFL